MLYALDLFDFHFARARSTVTTLSHEGPTLVHYDKNRRPVLVLSHATLRVIAGPSAGLSAEIALDPLIVGSDPTCDLCLPDPKVSRRHLEVRLHSSGYLLRDLDSTNGTHYRGARVHDVLIGPGAELRLGDTVLRIDRGEETTSPIAPQTHFGSLIGTSRPMQEVFGLLAAVAPTDTTVLILGETGTGKELVAEALHQRSPRHDKPFSVLDCGAVPEHLIESELFGHKRGAFTGATTDRTGIFEEAEGGTVFLDEIGELPLALQTRLLRVLDKRSIKRLGENTRRDVDVRIIAATHKDLADQANEGAFRQDLFYRLSVIEVHLPPLRNRREDIPALVRHFLHDSGVNDPSAVLAPEVLKALETRSWPGNIRELRNVVERALVLADSGLPLFKEAAKTTPPLPKIDREDDAIAANESLINQPPSPPQAPSPSADVAETVAFDEAAEGDTSWLLRSMPAGFLDHPYKEAKETLLNEFERAYLDHLVGAHGTNITHLASAAKIDRHLVRKLLRKHGLLL
ncbi:MAG: sigma 54-dependent Fis family transcriptional regulator [Deltaproteobacteria bacterium]|nr:sigma 54-dependent Fis family transcriptional regulator [Deltaproteobacteria bacterium]